MAAGDLLELSNWLRDNLYAWGRKLTPKETLGRLTGSDAIDPQPYLAYLGDKMAQLALARLGRWSHSSGPRRSWTTSRSACSRRFPPAPSSSTRTRIWGTTSTACAAGPTSCSRIFDRVGIERTFTFCLDEPDREPAFTRRERPHARLRGEPTPTGSSRSCASTSPRARSRRRGAASTSAPAGSSFIPAPRSSRVGDERLDAVFALAVEREVPILIHGGRGLPPIGDHLAALVERYAGVRLIIAHAGIADLGGLAGHFAYVPGVFFDTSVWSIVDLLDLMRQVAPEQILFATDYPYGTAAELAPARASRGEAVATSTRTDLRRLLGETAQGIADGAPLPALSPAKGPEEITTLLPLARIHAYIAMATPLLWMRQPDVAGGLGLALNAAHEANIDGVPDADLIRAALTAASELWVGIGEIEDRQESERIARAAARSSSTSRTSWP